MLRLPTKMNFGKPSKGSSASISLDDHEAKVGELNDQLATVVAERDQAKKEAAENLTLAETADAKVSELTEKLANAEKDIERLNGSVQHFKAEVEKLEAAQSDFDEKVDKAAAAKAASTLSAHGAEPLPVGDSKTSKRKITRDELRALHGQERTKAAYDLKTGTLELVD